MTLLAQSTNNALCYDLEQAKSRIVTYCSHPSVDMCTFCGPPSNPASLHLSLFPYTSSTTSSHVLSTIILPLLLRWCETWLLTLRAEVTGDWRRLHNKELYALCSSPNITHVIKSRRQREVGHVAHMGQSRGAYGGID